MIGPKNTRTNARSAKRAGQAGFSLVEVTVAAALSVVVMGVGFSTLGTGRDASKRTVSLIDVDEKVRKVLQRFAHEIRFASRQAEDTNDNNLLDSGEDTNGNGRFEDDWSVGGNNVTFNVRRPNGNFSLPITYKLVAGNLKKVVMLDASGRKSETTLLRGVSRFVMLPTTRGLKVTLAVQVRNENGKMITRTDSVTVTRRN